jgi:2-polyprenyl-6-methoxyphenol hydroxylase-like FAD-dependent oxidoreductase
MNSTPPVVVVGAGPIGLAAAAHAQARGLDVVVLEAGAVPGSAVREWGHVRLFSRWDELTDPAAEELLAGTGWIRPDAATYPTGAEWADRYLAPLARALAATDEVTILFGHRVTGIARRGRDRLVDAGRATEPFVVRVTGPTGQQRMTASAVIDASGTWSTPSPLGTDGYPALGEADHADHITYGMPDFEDPETAARYAARHIVVAGTGASAQNVLVDLAQLAEAAPSTRVSWLVRRDDLGTSLSAGDNDQLAERGALGARARRVAATDLVTTRYGFRAVGLRGGADGRVALDSEDGQVVEGVDEIVVVTGFRPDLTFLSEVRLDLDPVLSAPTALAPLIDPNHHSCGDVQPHGSAVLTHPEAGLYLAGMKSYGRAPSFLALTGFEQVRSIVAAIAGDDDAAARVELVLPGTGGCGGSALAGPAISREPPTA